MPRLSLSSVVVLAAVLVAAPSAGASERTMTVINESMSAGYGSCSGGVFGETVEADLVYHEVVRMVTDDEQVTRFSWLNADAITGYGVGSETGTRYRITYFQTGNIMSVGQDMNGADVLTSIRHIRVVPLGQPTPGSTLEMWDTFHYTVTPDGDLVAEVVASDYECV
jgi:opacity protein-like surface antigen